MKRLTRESIPKEPPPVQDTPNPVPEVPLQLLLTRPRLIQDLNEDLERVVLFAKSSCMKWDENTALDEEYHELLADLYEHTLRHFVIREPCDGRTGKRGMCTGPANLVFRVSLYIFLLTTVHYLLKSICYVAKEHKKDNTSLKNTFQQCGYN